MRQATALFLALLGLLLIWLPAVLGGEVSSVMYLSNALASVGLLLLLGLLHRLRRRR